MIALRDALNPWLIGEHCPDYQPQMLLVHLPTYTTCKEGHKNTQAWLCRAFTRTLVRPLVPSLLAALAPLPLVGGHLAHKHEQFVEPMGVGQHLHARR